MVDFNLIKLDGKPIEKLVEVISNGIGVLYKPRAIRKVADAEAYRIGLIERAKAKAEAEGKEIELDFYERIEERLLHKEEKRQRNLDRITRVAAEQLQDEETVSDEDVDADWTSRFFNIAEDISNEEMQNVWGRILAGEVKQPRTYSLRTLEVLKNFSKKDAECFMKFARLAIIYRESASILSFNGEELLTEKYQLKFNERLLLEELGLINAMDLSMLISEIKEEPRREAFVIGDTVVIADIPKDNPDIKVGVLAFTKIGQELLSLVEFTPNLDYLQLFTSKIRRTGIKVQYGKLVEIKDGLLRFGTLTEVPFTEYELKAEEKRLEQEEAQRKRKEEQEKRQAEKEKREQERLSEQKEKKD